MDNPQVVSIMLVKAALTTLVLGSTAAGPLRAQPPAACGCSAQLAALAVATGSNYAGFRDKAGSPADSVRHEQYLGVLRARAARSLGADCVAVLESYSAYFRDGHLQVRFTEAGALLGSIPGFGAMPPLHADAAAAVSRGTGNDGNDPIVGEWESTSRRTRLRIVPAPPPYDASDRYALVLASLDTAWREGDVYATFVLDEHRGVYHATWYARGRHPQKWSAVVVGDTLLLSGFNGWHRVTGESAGPNARREPLRPSFRMVAPDAALLTLRSMQVQYAVEVDSLVRANADAMGRLDLLIIDVRGNQGGGDGTYMPLLPLLYTDTIVIGPGSVLSLPAIIAYYEQFLDPAGVNSPAWVVEMLAAMRADPGSQIPLPEVRFAYDRVLPAPERIAILTDAAGASSTETFLLRAVQSRKVRIFGQPTAGIVDYLNPAHHPIGCGVALQAPTIRRAGQLPDGAIDGRGIAPHVTLPWREKDPISAILASYGLRPF